MKQVSIQDLKRTLSSCLREAEAGEPIVVTRHRRPIVSLRSAALEHVHVGARFGRATFRPALRQASHGRYLAILLDDRRGPER